MQGAVEVYQEVLLLMDRLYELEKEEVSVIGFRMPGVIRAVPLIVPLLDHIVMVVEMTVIGKQELLSSSSALLLRLLQMLVKFLFEMCVISNFCQIFKLQTLQKPASWKNSS